MTDPYNHNPFATDENEIKNELDANKALRNSIESTRSAANTFADESLKQFDKGYGMGISAALCHVGIAIDTNQPGIVENLKIVMDSRQ